MIREGDLGAKRGEFQAWAIETQNVDIEILGKVLDSCLETNWQCRLRQGMSATLRIVQRHVLGFYMGIQRLCICHDEAGRSGETAMRCGKSFL